MRTWPLVWRDPLGYCDRMCPHGFGHPDPDDVVHLQSVGGAATAHDCDGCCIAPLRTVDQHGRREMRPDAGQPAQDQETA